MLGRVGITITIAALFLLLLITFGRLPFWTLLAYVRGAGETSADVTRPGSQATMVHLWALLCYHGMA